LRIDLVVFSPFWRLDAKGGEVLFSCVSIWFPFGFGQVTSFYRLLACVPLLNSIWIYRVELRLLCVELSYIY
jgi:hypothetical protein